MPRSLSIKYYVTSHLPLSPFTPSFRKKIHPKKKMNPDFFTRSEWDSPYLLVVLLYSSCIIVRFIYSLLYTALHCTKLCSHCTPTYIRCHYDICDNNNFSDLFI